MCNERLEFLGQATVLLTQFGVTGAVLLNLGLDFAESALEMGGDVLPLEVIFSAPLQGLLLHFQHRRETVKQLHLREPKQLFEISKVTKHREKRQNAQTCKLLLGMKQALHSANQ